MRKTQASNNHKSKHNHNNSNNSNGFIPNSLRLLSSCIKTVSSNVRSAGASVAASISADADDLRKDQVLLRFYFDFYWSGLVGMRVS